MVRWLTLLLADPDHVWSAGIHLAVAAGLALARAPTVAPGIATLGTDLDLSVYRERRWSPTSEAPREGASMPTYVSLINWTDQGIKNYKDTTSRAADFTKLAESLGGRVRELLWTIGEYDLVTVVDFPDDETATATFLRVGSLGNIRTNTLRAFNTDEMDAIIRRAG
jgi:uncharacterized protein with GYD domain